MRIDEVIEKFEVRPENKEIYVLINSEKLLDKFKLEPIEELPESAKNSSEFINLDTFFTIPMTFIFDPETDDTYIE